jgi:predicted phosphodiesterase
MSKGTSRRGAIPRLPPPATRTAGPYHIDEPPGWWLVLSDTHFPYHDRRTIHLAVKEAKRRRARGVLLNGDIMDCHELSRWSKSPKDPRYPDEVKLGREFLAWLRRQLPRARIVWKDGNHEERLYNYLIDKAPALFGLISLPELLHFEKHGIEYVTDRRVIRLGKLHVIHGHEYQPQIQTPVNAARGLFLRAKSVAICGHFHQSSHHREPTISGKPQAAWSVGCACDLHPRYMPLNKWNLGFALVHLSKDGEFSVDNKCVYDGKAV